MGSASLPCTTSACWRCIDSALMQHDPVYVAASFAVAIIASALGMRFAFTPRSGFPVALAAVLFGLAISGMHYIAMAGLTLGPFAGHSGPPGRRGRRGHFPDLLAVIVTVVAFAVSAVFLLTLVPDHGPRPAVLSPHPLPRHPVPRHPISAGSSRPAAAAARPSARWAGPGARSPAVQPARCRWNGAAPRTTSPPSPS